MTNLLQMRQVLRVQVEEFYQTRVTSFNATTYIFVAPSREVPTWVPSGNDLAQRCCYGIRQSQPDGDGITRILRCQGWLPTPITRHLLMENITIPSGQTSKSTLNFCHNVL